MPPLDVRTRSPWPLPCILLGVVLLPLTACWLVDPLDHLPIAKDAAAAGDAGSPEGAVSACGSCNGGCCDNSGACWPGSTTSLCGGTYPGTGAGAVPCTDCASTPVGGLCAFVSAQYACGLCANSTDCTSPATCSITSHLCCLPSGASGASSNPQYCCSGQVSGGVCE